MSTLPYTIVGVIAAAVYVGVKIHDHNATAGPVPTPVPAVATVLTESAPVVQVAEREPRLLCSLENSVTNEKDLPCNLTEVRPTEEQVILTYEINGKTFTFYGFYADGGIEVEAAKFNNGSMENVFGFCEVGDGEGSCKVTNGTELMTISAGYDVYPEAL